METSIVETQTASARITALLTMFDYHTEFFKKAIQGLSEQDMHNRLNTAANHPAWLAGALIHQRFMMTSEAGTSLKQTGAELFANHHGIQDGVKYPTVEQYLQDWQSITPEARQALMKIDDKKLDSEMDMGGKKMSFYEMICFSIYREASMIGQLALWRRLLGYPAMRYE